MSSAVGSTALLALVAALLALLVTVSLWLRQQALLRRYRLLLSGPAGQDLERLLLRQAAELEGLGTRLSLLESQVAALDEACGYHVQRVGIVRYQAFADTGSDLSFSIALLDGHDNGLVLTTLYGRSESRTYAKPIRGGGSTYPLSDEEKEALHKARWPAPQI